MASPKKNQSLATKLIHADSEYNDLDIGPAISVSSSTCLVCSFRHQLTQSMNDQPFVTLRLIQENGRA